MKKKPKSRKSPPRKLPKKGQTVFLCHDSALFHHSLAAKDDWPLRWLPTSYHAVRERIQEDLYTA